MDIYLKQVFILHGDSEGKVIILGYNSDSHCAKIVLINMCIIPHCYEDSAVSGYKYGSVISGNKERENTYC